ncbi:hypothetical protein [Nonomuraea sp. NPDC005692]|uniref:hypothetical protein n=1 Tax=Nonomuraea sp. NPDC005692 TaxID=3157168 RepID=UPI0033FE3852
MAFAAVVRTSEGASIQVAFVVDGDHESSVEMPCRFGSAVRGRLEEQRRLAAAHENSRVARIAMGVCTGSLGLLASLASLVPTDDDRDPAMPDYSDPHAVMMATTASGFALFFFVSAIMFLWRSNAAAVLPLLLLAGETYRFVTVVPHYTG